MTIFFYTFAALRDGQTKLKQNACRSELDCLQRSRDTVFFFDITVFTLV